MHKHTLSIDLETYSPTDIKSAGAYKYAEQVEILLFAYSLDGGDVKCLDLACGEEMPQWLLDALTDEDYLKTAWNAAFERAVLSSFFSIYTPPEQWEDTMMRAAMAGLPLALGDSAVALGAVQRKDYTGSALIRYFCIPCKPTKTNGERTRNYPHHDPVKWQQFIDYCKQDVRTEQSMAKSLSWFQIPEQEKRLWCLDQRINEQGVKGDRTFIERAIEFNTRITDELTAEVVRLTGIKNAKSVAQLKKWLSEEMDEEITVLNKEEVPKILDRANSDAVASVLKIRQSLGKTSVTKYVAMVKAMGLHDRMRGLLQFGGANRTMRWAGRLVQVQNLPKSRCRDWQLDAMRGLVEAADYDYLSMLFGDISVNLSQLIRTSFIPAEGHRFIVSDYASIEARVAVWLSDEKWVLEVFNTHGKIYEATAAKMFNVPLEKITKGSEYRAKGKIGVLSCSYGGGPNALIRMGALKEKGVTEEGLQGIVDGWRSANPKTVALWYEIGRCAIHCIKTGEKTIIGNKGLHFRMRGRNLLLYLPSGRFNCYANAKVEMEDTKIGWREQITYWGVSNEPGKPKSWMKQRTYGAKLFENICQSVARDCLANGLLNLEAAGYKTVMHVHDEVVCEMPIGKGSLEEVNELLIKPMPWMKGLPLAAEGFESFYYKKDND